MWRCSQSVSESLCRWYNITATASVFMLRLANVLPVVSRGSFSSLIQQVSSNVVKFFQTETRRIKLLKLPSQHQNTRVHSNWMKWDPVCPHRYCVCVCVCVCVWWTCNQITFSTSGTVCTFSLHPPAAALGSKRSVSLRSAVIGRPLVRR